MPTLRGVRLQPRHGVAVVGLIVALFALMPWFSVPRMSVEQSVTFPATSVSAAQRAQWEAMMPAGLQRMTADDPASVDFPAELYRGIEWSATSTSLTYTVVDSDARRALAETRALTNALLRQIPGAAAVKPDLVGYGIVGRDPNGALCLVAVVGVLAATLAGAARAFSTTESVDSIGPNPIWVALSALVTAAVVGLNRNHTWADWAAGPLATLAVVAAWYYVVRGLGWWRAAVAWTLTLTVFRSGAFSGFIPDSWWQAAQFGGVAVAVGVTVAAAVAGMSLGRRRSSPPPGAETGATSVRSSRLGRLLRRPDVGFVAALALLALWALASTLWSPFRSVTLAQAGLFALVVAFLATAVLGRWRDQATLVADIAVVFWTGAVGLLLAWLPGLPRAAAWATEPRTGRFVGFTSNSNFAGPLAAVLIALGLGVMWHSRARLAPLVAVAALLFPLYATGSRGALVAAALAVAVFLAERRLWRWLLGLLLTVGLAVAGMVATGHPPSIFVREEGGHSAGPDSGRATIYGQALRLWRQEWWHGHGYRTTERIVATGQTAHNVVLSTLVELGMIGGLLFALTVAAIAWAAFRRRPVAFAPAALAALVAEQVNSALYGFSGPAALTMWIAGAATAAAGAAGHSVTPAAADASPAEVEETS